MGETQIPLNSENDVELYTSPWVSGTRAAAYFGPISSELFLQDDQVEDRSSAWSKAERELLESLRDKARLLGANAVVGLEVTLDPFARAQRLRRDGAPAPRGRHRREARTAVLTGPGAAKPRHPLVHFRQMRKRSVKLGSGVPLSATKVPLGLTRRFVTVVSQPLPAATGV